MTKRKDGRETWHRLRDWDKGQASSERLGAQILIHEKYEAVDPSHPLGGRDGGKDMLCTKENKKYVVAVFFPRGQKAFNEILKKFKADVKGIKKNKTDGIIFITNQELSLSEREQLKELADECRIIHLEQIMMILNAPTNYGSRLEYLDIEMTKEEQLSYMATKDSQILNLQNDIKQIAAKIQQPDNQEKSVSNVTVTPTTVSYGSYGGNKPFHKCSHCKYGFMIAGRHDYSNYGYSGYSGISIRVDTEKYPSVFSATTISAELVTCPKCGNVEEC